MLSKPTSINLLIVDDHFIARKGLVGSLSSEKDIHIVAEGSNGIQAVKLYAEHRPDIVLMDVSLPLMDGIQSARAILEEDPNARVIMLTVSDADEDILSAVDAGARGYLSKSIERQQLLFAIRQVAKGETFFSSEIQMKMNEIHRIRLTKREAEVLEKIVKGRSNKEIADDLQLAEPTVRLHLTHLFKKLGVLDRTQAAITAIKRGLIRLE